MEKNNKDKIENQDTTVNENNNQKNINNETVDISILLSEIKNLKEELKTVKEENKGLTEEEFKKMLESQKNTFNLSQAELIKMSKEENKNTKKILDAEPKVRVKVPIDKLNPKDLVVPVQINGYTYFINRGQTVDVPESVAKLLSIGGYI